MKKRLDDPRRASKRVLLPIVVVGLCAAACNGTTGDALYTFAAYAAGAEGAGDPFTVGGYTIQLTLADMYVGALYVNEAPGGSGATFNTPACVDTGVYCAQVPGGTEVNLLDSTAQPWTSGVQGSGSADLGLSWQMYLTSGDVNDGQNMPATSNDGAVYDTVDLQGTATRGSDGAVFTFAATVNINQDNDGTASPDPGQPGLDPICLQRIVNSGGTSLTLYEGASMLLTIDPRGWFHAGRGIDFSTLPPVSSPQCTEYDSTSNYGGAEYCIPDSTKLPGDMLGAQQGENLYEGVFTGGPAAYSLTYFSPP